MSVCLGVLVAVANIYKWTYD